jgi:tRNA G18 (ribose-2'-O)-methylase SpoU
MSDHQKSYCDSFVYIPQYGVGTASFNVNVATCLVLHHIANTRAIVS